MIALPSITQGGSPVRELRTPGFVRGALSNERPYRDRSLMGIPIKPSRNLTATGTIAIKNVGHAQSTHVAVALGFYRATLGVTSG